jgi:Pyruvate/2-oxoacid:ferredoxin oxidoreductase delta subunit
MEARIVMRRTIIRIDEEKCDGCGECVIACAEGAIEIVDGKARLVSEAYCDGLGACIGECPRGAITAEEREVEGFDRAAAQRHAAAKRAQEMPVERASSDGPSMAVGKLRGESASQEAEAGEGPPSELSNWPVQIHLVPPHAPYLQGARLLIAADCVPFAFGDFHRRFLRGRALLVGCPKLDDAWFYRAKLAQVFSQNEFEEIEIIYMEVPCCSGLVRIVREALDDAGREAPIRLTKIGIHGENRESRLLESGRQ